MSLPYHYYSLQKQMEDIKQWGDDLVLFLLFTEGQLVIWWSSQSERCWMEFGLNVLTPRRLLAFRGNDSSAHMVQRWGMPVVMLTEQLPAHGKAPRPQLKTTKYIAGARLAHWHSSIVKTGMRVVNMCLAFKLHGMLVSCCIQ